jgi:hypothetical protein
MTMTRAILTILCGAFIGCSATHPAYGRWEQPSRENSLNLPDFELYYIGTEPDAHIQFGIVYSFEARKGDERVVFAWTSGTGLIVASPFEIGGRRYFLEMVKSEFLIEQAPGKAVAVWPEEDWESHRNSWWRVC